MKKTYLPLLIAAMALASCHKQTFDERVMEDVNHFNEKEAPKQIDLYTSFDSMRYEKETQTVSYFYTISGDADSEELFASKEIEMELLKNLRNSIQLKPHKEHGMQFHYRYISNEHGTPLLDVTFTPDDYK
ncbi:MAG: hypothetical protein IJ762_02335 [Bacteroidaceae bacterium]|nr:hypothetical protein [Bacteroidaceae bacterium]MBR1788016.1 hypothetical protein [Bacteroidaceae bacterium]